MKPTDLVYHNLIGLIAKYNEKGRRESANFLNWFLENIYRLDSTTADDAICDESNDKGIDGIYIDHNSEEIHFFQSKITQKLSSIGDASVKQFVASVQQFDTPEKIDLILSGNANADLKKIVSRNNLRDLIEKGYQTKAIFFTNSERDQNTVEIESHFSNLRVFSASDICENYIEFDAEEGIDGEFIFDTKYAGFIEFSVDKEISAYILPVPAKTLINLDGISDGKLFSQNVRYSLGNTPVNKAIAQSIIDNKEHKQFFLYHNGITLICKTAIFDESTEALKVHNYVVVNGAQSITTFFHNSAKLSDDLQVLVKIISLKSDALARKITINSNNQNAIKPRDLRSNHDLMLRLRKEFEKANCGYEFEIKRGQPASGTKKTISNEEAGRDLLAFDLNEPYSCHQIYRVFDEKYAETFGRREVTYGRIIFLSQVRDAVSDALDNLENRAMAKYALTKYFIMNVVGQIMRLFENSQKFLRNSDTVNSEFDRAEMIAKCKELLQSLIIDLNYEITEAGDSFDYKKELKSPESVKNWKTKLIRSYEKDFMRGKAVGFGISIKKFE